MLSSPSKEHEHHTPCSTDKPKVTRAGNPIFLRSQYCFISCYDSQILQYYYGLHTASTLLTPSLKLLIPKSPNNLQSSIPCLRPSLHRNLRIKLQPLLSPYPSSFPSSNLVFTRCIQHRRIQGRMENCIIRRARKENHTVITFVPIFPFQSPET